MKKIGGTNRTHSPSLGSLPSDQREERQSLLKTLGDLKKLYRKKLISSKMKENLDKQRNEVKTLQDKIDELKPNTMRKKSVADYSNRFDACVQAFQQDNDGSNYFEDLSKTAHQEVQGKGLQNSRDNYSKLLRLIRKVSKFKSLQFSYIKKVYKQFQVVKQELKAERVKFEQANKALINEKNKADKKLEKLKKTLTKKFFKTRHEKTLVRDRIKRYLLNLEKEVKFKLDSLNSSGKVDKLIGEYRRIVDVLDFLNPDADAPYLESCKDTLKKFEDNLQELKAANLSIGYKQKQNTKRKRKIL